MLSECERHVNAAPERTSRARRQGLAWMLALAAGAAVIAWPWLSGQVTIPWDAKAQFLPQLQFLAQSLARGESPFWTPNVFAGHPQIADAQSLIFSPPFFLLALASPAPGAWAMDVAVYCFLTVSALAFMRWLMDKDVHPFAAFTGALAFAFGAAMAWRVQHVGQVLSLGYLPFVLLCLDRALERRSIGWGIGAGIAAAFLVLGRDQVALLSIYFLTGYVIWHWATADAPAARVRETLAPLIAGGITGGLLIAVPILMTLLLAADSNRPEIDLEGAGRGSLHPALLLTAFAPDVFGSSGRLGPYWGPPSMIWNGTGLYIAQNMGQLYIGAVALLALIWGTITRTLWEKRARFYAIALVLSLLYALGWYTPVFQLFHAILPGVDLYRRPADAVFNIGFLASVLAAFALDGYLKTEARPARGDIIAVFAVLAAAFATMLGFAAHFGRLHDATIMILLPLSLIGVAGALLLAIKSTPPRYQGSLLAALAVLTVADLAISNGPGGATGLPPQTYESLEPDTRNDTVIRLKERTAAHASATVRDRVEIVGFGFHWPNIPLAHDLEATLGYNPVRLSWLTRALGAGDTVGLPDQKGFSPLFASYRSPLANLIGLRTIATSVPIEEIDKTLKPGDLPLIARTSEGYIYDNPDALPRVLFAPDAAQADFETVLTTGQWPRTDFAKTVLLESPPAAQPSRPSGTVRIVRYENTRVELQADSPGGGYAVLNDVWHPWWFATLDGAEIPLLRANVIFRAVAVPPGRHTIVFQFRPVRGALAQIGF